MKSKKNIAFLLGQTCLLYFLHLFVTMNARTYGPVHIITTDHILSYLAIINIEKLNSEVDLLAPIE